MTKKILKIKKISYGRVGLLGNPSDHYGGKCLSFTFDKKAEVTVRNSSELVIEGGKKRDLDLSYNGSNDLIKAVIKNLKLENNKFKITYKSQIPLASGLAGSSAISVAAIRALNEYFNLNLNSFEIAEKSRMVEIEELGNSLGFQDGYSTAFGGVLFMDFKSKTGHGKYFKSSYGVVKRIPIKRIPCFLCLSGAVKKNSGAVHDYAKAKFLNGNKKEKMEIKNYMGSIADLAEQGIKALALRDWKKLGFLMNKNRELRDQIYPALEEDKKVIETALGSGALGVKLTGSGGAIAVLTDEHDSKKVFEKMTKNYFCFKPKISSYN